MKKISKRIWFILFVLILCSLAWFFLVHPYLLFLENEKVMKNAAIRYFEINANELPTGERVKTLSLATLYKGKYIENDLLIPNTGKNCSISDSWVKVRKEEGEYRYYVYLNCGIFSSRIDHTGPVIKLNGDSELTLALGEEYKELGVKSVSDKVDGKMVVKDAITVKGDVNTDAIGTYEVKYIAFDKLGNKTTVTRVVHVIQQLYQTVKNDLGDATNYKGNPTNNYIRFSNMIYRIWGVDSNKNVIIVQDMDVSNVNYTKIDDWLKYYYDHLTDKSKEYIVDSEYCNMGVEEANLGQTTCSSYTEKRSVYLPSIVEVNKAQGDDDINFMKPFTMSWVSTYKDSKEAYVTRDYFVGDENGKSFLPYDVVENYGIRPMITLKGDSYLYEGDGTELSPYFLKDTTKAKNGSYLNERNTGEYIFDGITYWMIIDTLEDGTTKVISETNIGRGDEALHCFPNPDSAKIVYNPKDRLSVAYYINNQVSEYIDTSKFVNHTIDVPIYKDNIIYGEEVETKTYKAVLSAPNMYEMFSAFQTLSSSSYWLINSSQADYMTGAITEIGVPYNGTIVPYTKLNIRVVGYFNKGTIITNGNGTSTSPYRIK